MPAWPHSQLQGEAIDTKGLPFAPEMLTNTVPFQLLSEHTDLDIGSDEATITHSLLYSPNLNTHGRSFELGSKLQPLGIWADSQGNRYSSLSFKGAVARDIKVEACEVSPSGFRVNGLQDDEALVRTLRASRILREAGIRTEWIVGVLEPKAFPLDMERDGLASLKKALVEGALADRRLQPRISEVAEFVGKSAFFVTVRATDIGERLWDFGREGRSIFGQQVNVDMLNRIVTKTFKVYNAEHASQPEFIPLNPESPVDIEHYFTQILPGAIGRQYGKLHELGLAHKYPHFGNITLLGGIVDLDSVHGEKLELGDAVVEPQDLLHDISRIAHELDIESDYAQAVGRLLGGKKSVTGLAHSAQTAFYESYINQRRTTSHTFRQKALSTFGSVSGADMANRNEALIRSFREEQARMLARHGKAVHIEKTEQLVEHATTSIAQNPEFEAYLALDDQVNELLNQGIPVDQISARLMPLLASTREKIVSEQLSRAYKASISHISDAISKTYHNTLTPEMRNVFRAMATSVIDISDRRFTRDYYDNDMLTTALKTYVEGMAIQHDTTELSPFPWELVVSGSHAGKFYWVGDSIATTEFEQIVTNLPDTFVVHHVEGIPAAEDEWAWLSPMCYFTSTDSFTFSIGTASRKFQQFPDPDKSTDFVAMCTKKDDSGNHHLLIWQNKKID